MSGTTAPSVEARMATRPGFWGRARHDDGSGASSAKNAFPISAPTMPWVSVSIKVAANYNRTLLLENAPRSDDQQRTGKGLRAALISTNEGRLWRYACCAARIGIRTGLADSEGAAMWQ